MRSRLLISNRTPKGLPQLLLLTIIVTVALRSYNLNSLPISLNLDEATNGLDAWGLLHPVRLTPFLPNNFGRETLFFYLQGAALVVFGVSIFTLRWVSMAAGVLTVPLLYRVGVRLFGSRWLGLLAAAALATSYWHIYFSRLALRGILLPPLLLLSVWNFWRGWFPVSNDAGSARPRLVLAGLMLGVTQYSYLAARLLPLIFGVFIGLELLLPQPGASRRHKLADALIFGGIALLVTIPLLTYFWQQPAALTDRAGTISVINSEAPLRALKANGLALLRLHLLPLGWLGRWPPLNWLTMAGLLVGLAVALRHWRTPVHHFVLLWGGMGWLPVLLSVQNWSGETTLLRGIVAWPPIFLLAGLGWLRLYRWLAGYRPRISPGAVAGLLLVTGGLGSGYTYFVTPASPVGRGLSDHPSYLARALNQAEQPTLLPLQFYAETATHFLLKQHYPRLVNAAASSLLPPETRLLLPPKQDSAVAFVLLSPAEHTAFLLPPLSATTQHQLAAQVATLIPLDTVLDSESEVIANLYPAPSPALFAGDILPTNSLPLAEFSNGIRLLSAQVEPAIAQPGDQVSLHLNWQAQSQVERSSLLFVHLFDVATRQRWGQIDEPLTGLLFDAVHWPPGLIVPDTLTFTLPLDAPPGPYRFELGLIAEPGDRRLPLNNGGDSLMVSKLHLGAAPAPPQINTPGISFGKQIALLGLDISGTDNNLTYTLHWQALTAPAADYIAFNHLLSGDGQIVAQQDAAPQQGQYPTSWWTPGELVLDTYRLPIPTAGAADRLTLRLGWYDSSGQRLTRDGVAQDYFDLPLK